MSKTINIELSPFPFPHIHGDHGIIIGGVYRHVGNTAGYTVYTQGGTSRVGANLIILIS